MAANIQRAKLKLAELVKAQSKTLMPSFGDCKDDQRAIEILNQEITDLLRISEKRLRKLSCNGSSEDSNLRKNAQMSKLKQSEFSTVEREREITQVVKSANELSQIMKDLSVLLIDQGTIFDRIDCNSQNVATSVEEGIKQLLKAEHPQEEGGMVMCATVLVFLCFIMIALLILEELLL